MKRNESKGARAVDVSRRSFLGAALAGPAATAAGAVLSGSVAAQPKAEPAIAAAPTASRYRDTEHVRTYYRLAGLL